MKPFKIMAPTRNLEMTRYQCDAGANELYLGLDGREINRDYVHFTFNGRYNQINNVRCQVETVAELKKIIDYAHAHNVEINYTANIHYLSSEFKKEFDAYIDIGLALGIDYFIVSNIGLIQYLRKRGIDTPIVAGVFLVIPNVEQAGMLADMGVQRVVLPQAVTLEELRAFKNRSGLEIEMFGHFGGGNNCGRCMLLHSPTIDDIGPGCRAAYDVTIDGRKTAEMNYFFDAACDCCFCSLPELMDIGVDVVKVVGRESSNKFVNSKITELYKLFRDYLLDGVDVAEIKARFKEEQLVWTSIWQPRFCERQRCRFHDTAITRSYIV